MRKLSFLILLLTGFLFSSYRIAEEDPVISNLSCYRTKPNTVNHHEYNIWVITTPAALEENFMGEPCAAKPDFEKQILVGLVAETDVATYKTYITRVTRKAQVVNIYFTIRRSKASLQEGSPLEMISFAKDPSVKKINFYHGDYLVKSVPIVSVY